MADKNPKGIDPDRYDVAEFYSLLETFHGEQEWLAYYFSDRDVMADMEKREVHNQRVETDDRDQSLSIQER